MADFELGSSGIGSSRSANFATTTTGLLGHFFYLNILIPTPK